MTKVIILPDEDLDRFYERTLNYLHAKYHCQPTTIRKSNVKVSKYDFSTSTNKIDPNDIPIGKRIG